MTAPTGHSKYSASASARWMACPGSMVLVKDAPRKSTTYSRWGTAAHNVAANALETGYDAAFFKGMEMDADGERVPVDQEMVDCVQEYIDLVRGLRDALDAELLVEQRLDYGKLLNSDEAWGTGDAVLLAGDEIIVIDLKTGQGEKVDPEGNTQLMLYALGALAAHPDRQFKTVRIMISQPRAGGTSEWATTVDALLAFAGVAERAIDAVETAELCRDDADLQRYLVPGEKQCRWCPAAATCPALRAEVADLTLGHTPATAEDFAEAGNGCAFTVDAQADAEWLAAAMSKAPLVEHWLKAVRGEVEARLLAGTPVPGFKLVRGKQGNRAWADEQAAEDMLRKTFRLKVEEAYDMKLISPTSAEKVLADQPKRWAKMQPLITRADGKLSVAPESDKRPAIQVGPVADEFTDETAPVDVSSFI